MSIKDQTGDQTLGLCRTNVILLENLRSAWVQLVGQASGTGTKNSSFEIPKPDILGAGNTVSMAPKSLNISI